MMSTTKFALGFALTLLAAPRCWRSPRESPRRMVRQLPALRVGSLGGPAYCAVSGGTGWWGCLAVGYKCTQGGNPCGKKPSSGTPVSSPTPTLAGG